MFELSTIQSRMTKLIAIGLFICAIVGPMLLFITWKAALLVLMVTYTLFLIGSIYLAIVMFKHLNWVIATISDRERSIGNIDENRACRLVNADVFVRVLVRLNVLVCVTLLTNIVSTILCVMDLIWDSMVTKNLVSLAFNLDAIANIVCLFLQFAVFDKCYYKLCQTCDAFLQAKYKNSKYLTQTPQVEVN